ncbi:TrmH family RNA methyltransferase [Paraconexibacter sp.]|uniref:TrmH family RNA methyltransferase n=1 Tax=Paraconexibacter sp. TaxID=2949640 RepID=UPI00356614E1
MDRVAIEGFHALKHAHRFGAVLDEVAVADRSAALALADDLAPDLRPVLEGATEIGVDGIARWTTRPVPTGVVCRARRPEQDVDRALEGAGPVVLLDHPRDPGNVGAAIRVSAAAGAAVVLVTGPVDPWHPACVRGAAGLQFAQPVIGLPDLPADLRDRPIVAVDPEGERSLDDPGPLAGARPVLAFGTERHGLGPEVRRRAAVSLAIPMRDGVSSLNLATSVAVVLYGLRTARAADG